MYRSIQYENSIANVFHVFRGPRGKENKMNKNRVLSLIVSAAEGAAIGAIGSVVLDLAVPYVKLKMITNAIKKAGHVPGQVSWSEDGQPSHVMSRSPKGKEVVISCGNGYIVSTGSIDTISAPSLGGLTEILKGIA